MINFPDCVPRKTENETTAGGRRVRPNCTIGNQSHLWLQYSLRQAHLVDNGSAACAQMNTKVDPCSFRQGGKPRVDSMTINESLVTRRGE